VETELVGREVELGAALTAVRSGTGAVVIGAAGVGKTTLANKVAEHARAEGDEVLWTVATEASRRIPFGALGVLVPDDVSSFHPALAIGLIGRRLRELNRRRPALVVVDDAHLLDEQSAVTLLGLVSTGAARALVTLRGRERLPDAVTALWKDAYLASVDLEPLDRQGTQLLLVHLVGAEVAGTTVELLWQWTQGNPLYLAELVRFGRADGRLTDVGGLWMWQGDLGVPPRLAELLDRRFDGLSPAGVDALCAVVLAQPLSLETLVSIVSGDAVAELETEGLVEAEERDGMVWLTVGHPLMVAAAARFLTPMRRRRLADSLVEASRGRISVSRRASWLLDSSQPPDVDRLVVAARDVLLSNPTLAARFAERALAHDAGPEAALALADAYAELGRGDAAWDAWRLAFDRARTDDERLIVYLNEISLTTWTDRRPQDAVTRLRELRDVLPPEAAVELDSAAALCTLFSARPAEALARADKVLAVAESRTARTRALIARVGGLNLGGRRREALIALEDLLALVSRPGATPYHIGLANAMAALVGLTEFDAPVPSVHPASVAGTDRRRRGRPDGVATGRRRSPAVRGRPNRGAGPPSRVRGPPARRRGPVPVRSGRVADRGAGVGRRDRRGRGAAGRGAARLRDGLPGPPHLGPERARGRAGSGRRGRPLPRSGHPGE
jgi:hypothetical protein